jgi:hypothetical protein
VQVRMADAAEENFDLDIVFGQVAPLDRIGSQQ